MDIWEDKRATREKWRRGESARGEEEEERKGETRRGEGYGRSNERIAARRGKSERQ